MRPIRAVIVASAVLGAGSAQAQDRPLRAGLLGAPRVGSPAPEVVLSYFLSTGPGPADQPFRLSAELGRVVVLIFGAGPGEAGRSGLARIGDRVAPLVGRSVVAAGVVRGGPEVVQALATGVTGPIKLLADPEGRVHRDYGLGRGTFWTVFVVGDDGRLVWSGRIDPGADAGWDAVGRAVRQGMTAAPPGW